MSETIPRDDQVPALDLSRLLNLLLNKFFDSSSIK